MNKKKILEKIRKKEINNYQEFEKKEIDKNNYSNFILNIENLIYLKEEDKSFNLLEKLNKKLDNKKINIECLNSNKITIDFLYLISLYLKFFSTEKNLHKFLKPLKKIINFIEENIDNIYLLFIENKFENTKEYNIFTNIKLIDSVEELSEKLNEFDETKLADQLFMIKGKVELGINRYFFNHQTQSIIKCFNEKGKFKLLSTFEKIKLINNFIVEEKFIKNIKKEFEKEIKKNQIDFILEYIVYNKKTNEKEFEKLLKKYELIIEYLPKEIISKKEFEKKIIISKSINKNFKEDFENKNNNYLISTYCSKYNNIYLKHLI